LTGSIGSNSVQGASAPSGATTRHSPEDVVGGQVDHRGAHDVAGARHPPGTQGIDAVGALRIGLAAIDIRPGTAVEDDLWDMVGDRGDDGRLIGHVKVDARQRHHLVAHIEAVVSQVQPQLAPGTRDQHRTSSRSRSAAP
jgi:hypothetical protein